MVYRISLLFVVWSAAADAALAQPALLGDARVIAANALVDLKFKVYMAMVKVDTKELKDRLHPTDAKTTAVLVLPAASADTDTVWYTDEQGSNPRPITVSRKDHTLVYEFAKTGTVIAGLDSVDKTVTEEIKVLVKGVGKEKDFFKTQIVTKTIRIAPAEDRVDAVAKEIKDVKEPAVQNLLEMSAGARFAEIYAPGMPVPKSARDLTDKYKKVVLDNAVAYYAAKPASDLPAMNVPIIFGKIDGDLTAMVRTVHGAIPPTSFNTDTAKFAAVWHKSILVLVRQSPASTNSRIILTADWVKTLDMTPAFEPHPKAIIPGDIRFPFDIQK